LIVSVVMLTNALIFKRTEISNWPTLAEAMTLLPFDGGHGVIAVSWTLYHEVAFYVVFSIMIFSVRLGAATGVVWALGCLAPLFLAEPNADLRPIFDPVNWLFVLGIGASVSFGKLTHSQATAALTCGGALYTGVWAWQVCHGQGGRGPFPDMAFGVASVMIIGGLAAIEARRGLAVISIFKLLGNASYSIYLTHFLALSLFAKVAHDALPGMPAALAFFLLATSALVSGVAWYVLVERPLLIWSRRHFFGASAPGEIARTASPLTPNP
jgi:peptidoglycan/LPS O-acetylase OafA/YrhL